MTGCGHRRRRAGARAAPARFAALAVAALVLLSCGGSGRGNDADTAAGDASDDSGEQAGAQPAADEPRGGSPNGVTPPILMAGAQPAADEPRGTGSGDKSAGAAAGGESGVVVACDGGSADDGLPQGHAGLGFDGRSAGMVEVFAGSYDRFLGQFKLQPVRLAPVSARPGGGKPQPVIEGFELELLDGSGVVVHSVPLRRAVRQELRQARWDAEIAARPAYASYRIRHGDRSIVGASGSAGPPHLSGVEADLSEAFREPGGFLPPRMLFVWTACDPDADTLSQFSYYSSGGGAGYRLVDETHTRHRPEDPNVTTTTIIYDDNFIDYTVPKFADTSQPRNYTHVEQPWNLEPAPSARFLVVVSDGVRWSAAISPEFEPAPHPTMYVGIIAPREGDVFGPVDEIVLLAQAEGAIDGGWRLLRHGMFRWSSDIDGEFTPEPSTQPPYRDLHGRVPEGFLSPGIHRITATATDQHGNTGSATVTVEVRR